MAGYCTSCGGTGFRKPSREATESAAIARVAELERILLSVQTLGQGFHACKNIRAWAAEENQRTKAAIIRITSEALGQESSNG